MADNEDFGTIIGADAQFKGEIKFDSSAKVLGKFEGSIASKGKVHIASGSKCKATISAKEVAVGGHIEGNVNATDRVDLQPKGIITGDIVAQRMSMAEGSSIEGHCRIGVNGTVGKAPSTTEVKSAAEPATAKAK